MSSAPLRPGLGGKRRREMREKERRGGAQSDQGDRFHITICLPRRTHCLILSARAVFLFSQVTEMAVFMNMHRMQMTCRSQIARKLVCLQVDPSEISVRCVFRSSLKSIHVKGHETILHFGSEKTRKFNQGRCLILPNRAQVLRW